MIILIAKACYKTSWHWFNNVAKHWHKCLETCGCIRNKLKLIEKNLKKNKKQNE